MDNKLRIGVVSYLNSRPFLAGLEQLGNRVKLVADNPSGLAGKLLEGALDIALVPVAVIPHLAGARIVSRFGIAADGPVKTVCLLAERPIAELDTIYLDYQSRTSVALARILFRDHWKQEPRFVAAFPGYESEIKGRTGGVVIGDRAIHLLERFPFVYDLSEAWKQYTGLPFVFAAWVAVRELPEAVLKELDQAFTYGLSQRDSIAGAYSHLNNSRFNTADYLWSSIRYELDEEMMTGLRVFLQQYAADHGLEVPEVSVPAI